MADHTSTPQFFLPLIPGFLTNFCIPKAFLKHLKLAESNNGNEFVAVLKDRNSGSDKAWPVQVDSDGRRFMDGWKEFAQEHGLRIGEFLIFRHLGGFVFDVLVLDPVTACNRSFAVDPSEPVRSEANEHVAESRSLRNSPSGDDGLVFDAVSVDPLVESACVRSEINDQQMAERGQVHPPSPSNGNAVVFDPVVADPLARFECVHSDINDRRVTENEQVPSPSTSNGDGLVFDPVVADPLIRFECVHSKINDQRMTECGQVPSPSKGNAVVFDPVVADPLIRFECVHSKINDQRITECEQVPSPSKGSALVFDPVVADPLIRFECVHSKINDRHITECEQVPSPSKGNALVFDPVVADPLIRFQCVYSKINDQSISEQAPLPSKGSALVFDYASADPLIQSDSAHSKINNDQLATESEQVPSPCTEISDLLNQSESVHSETNANEEHITESGAVPPPSEANPTDFDTASADPFFVQSETNEQHVTGSEQVPSQASPSKGDDHLIQPESVHLETNEHNPGERVVFKPSGRPYFRTPLKKYTFRWKAILIPKSFARANNLANRVCETIIIDQKDRSWTVNLTHRKGKNDQAATKDQVYLTGWDKVRDANDLKLGDSLVFEVIDSGSDPIIKLYKVS